MCMKIDSFTADEDFEPNRTDGARRRIVGAPLTI